MKIENNPFDEHIRQALKGLEEAHPSDWDVFEGKLTEAESGLDDAAFDGMMAAGLAGIEVDFDPNSWETFEEKLTTEQLTDNLEIDELARQSLTNFEAPYQKSHWEIMAERLEEEFSLRRKLYRYKVLEMALMLLFLLTLLNYLPFGGNKFEQLKAFHFELFNSTEIKVEADKPIQVEKNASEKEEILKNKQPTAPKESAENEEAPNATILNSQFIPANNWQNTASKQRPKQDIPVAMATKTNKVVIENPNTVYVGVEKMRANENLSSEDAPTERELQSMLTSLELPKTELLDLNNSLPSMVLVPNKEKGFWRVGMAGNFDANYVFSPDNDELGSSQDTTLGWGYGGGILANYKKSRWGLEIGALYNYKTYRPNFVNQFNTNNNPNLLEKEFFQDIQLDILQIPINAQYFIVDQPKWRIYASSGMTINMLLQPIYKIQETRAALVAMPAPAGPPSNEPDNSIKNKTEFPIGILEGGEFKDNSFLTANFGLGIERSVGARWSIFAQPSYQHQISKQGLRPFKDKFYTLSMTIGTRVTIK